jgi:hypothetical protein
LGYKLNWASTSGWHRKRFILLIYQKNAALQKEFDAGFGDRNRWILVGRKCHVKSVVR